MANFHLESFSNRYDRKLDVILAPDGENILFTLDRKSGISDPVIEIVLSLFEARELIEKIKLMVESP